MTQHTQRPAPEQLFVADEFFDYKPSYQAALEELTAMRGKKAASEELGSDKTYYDTQLARLQKLLHRLPLDSAESYDMHVLYALVLADKLWVLAGCPYYRVYPDYVNVFKNTQLDVPLRVLKLPHPSFLIRFSEAYPLQVDSLRCHALLVSEIASTSTTVSTLLNVVCLCTEDAGLAGDRHKLRSITFEWANDEEDKLVSLKLSETFAPSHSDVLDAASLVVKIVASVCFLATGGDRLVSPDVMNRDFPTYLSAVNAKRTAEAVSLGNKSHRQRNGRKGFTIGREETLLGKRAECRQDGQMPGEAGGELSYQHQRRGHFHKYWTGTNRSELQIRWVSQLTVRPDLPLSPALRVGSRTLDSKATEQSINED